MAGRPSDRDRARRLLSLLPHLSRKGRVRLADLAHAVGVDIHTLAEDLTTLSLCGTDARDPRSLVAVHIDGDEVVTFGEMPALDRPVRLTAAEARALATALESCGVQPEDPLLKRLADAATQVEDPRELAATVRATTSPGGVAHAYSTLVAAAAAHRVCGIRYFSASRGTESDRLVHPWQLLMSQGAWYLRGFCETAGEERLFRLDRITAVRPTGTPFTPPRGLEAPSGVAPSGTDLPRAEVVFAQDAPDLNPRDWPGTEFERRKDGRVVASVPYAGTGWVARKVVAKLGAAEAVAPSELREAVAVLARRLLQAG